MKSATIPALRVTPDTRRDAESVLNDGETLSSFVEQSVIRNIEHRKAQQAFIERGLSAKQHVQETGQTISAAESLAALDAILLRHQPS